MKYLIALFLFLSPLFAGNTVIYGINTNHDPRAVRVDDYGNLNITNVNEVYSESSVTNSTTNTLTANSVFIGGADDVSEYSAITILIHSDAPSATNGLKIQFSAAASVWHIGEEYTIKSNATKFFTPPIQAKYMRIMYSNGSQSQTEFNIHTMLKKYPIKWSSHNIAEPIVDEDDSELVKAVLTGKDPGNGYLNVAVTADGNLAISDNSSGLSIAQGNVSGASFIHKFGATGPDGGFDVADGFVTVWDGAEDGTAWEAMNYTYSATADIDGLSSTGTTDGQLIEIQGLDSSSNLIIQTVTLTGQTPVAIPTNLLRVFRLKNISSTNLTNHVFCFVNGGGLTGGVPNLATNIRAIIQPNNNQTLMAVFTIPDDGAVGYMRDWYASTAGAKRDSTHTIKVLARPPGGVFQLKHIANISVTGTSYIQHRYIEPEVFSAGTDIEVQMDTDQDAAGVAAGFDIVLVEE